MIHTNIGRVIGHDSKSSFFLSLSPYNRPSITSDNGLHYRIVLLSATIIEDPYFKKTVDFIIVFYISLILDNFWIVFGLNPPFLQSLRAKIPVKTQVKSKRHLRYEFKVDPW